MNIYFSTDKFFKLKILDILDKVIYEIYIMHFQINCQEIIEKINSLIKKNINVKILVDYSMNKNIYHYIDNRCQLKYIQDKLFHHKIMLIDDHIVIGL